MISLNLLPKNKKAEIGLTQFYITLKNVIILMLLITIMVAIVLLATKAALQNHFNEIVAQSTLTTQYATSFNQGVQKFNKKLSTVEKIQQDYVAWTDFFIIISQLVPPDVTISSIDSNLQKTLIFGVAKDRNALLQFQQNLKNSNIFKNVETPLENLLKRTDIDFNIKADINLDNL